MKVSDVYPGGNGAPVDWQAIKREILSRIDPAAEYVAMGVEFTRDFPNPKGWRECRAYGREDRKPSAAVNVLSWTYCSKGDGAETLGFFDFAARYGKLGDWRATLEHFAARAGVPLEIGPGRRDGSVEEAVYPYRDSDGQLVFEVVRLRLANGRKTFRQRRPDGKGGYVWNISGITPVPYRLPELLAVDPSDPVFLVEGERDVDRAIAEGLSATSNHQGADNTKVWEQYATYLIDREVFIIPDNDEPGRKHAVGIARFLHGHARSIKIVELPGLPEKGDLSDFLDGGGTIDELGHLAFIAPYWSPENAETAAPDPLDADATAADLIEINATIRWVWKNWIPVGVLTILASEPGVGKCLGRGTPVLMFDGSVRAVEDIRVGDLLMGPDSRPRTVLSIARGREAMYRVVPVKGDPYIVNESHILSLKMTGLGRAGLSHRYSSGQVVNISVCDYLAETQTFRDKAKGWRSGVDWPDRPVPLDPYFLGLWLGDGCRKSPSIAKPDPEIADYLRDFAPSVGLHMTEIRPTGKCPIFSVVGRKNVPNPVYSALKSLGVVEQRHVPHVYKANSRSVRLAILAGLLDTDGHMRQGGFEFVSQHRVLADDVVFLARSLGFAAYVKESVKGCQTGAVGTYHRVGISGDCCVIPTRIARKKAPCRRQVKNVLSTGIRIEPIGEDDYFGFTLDGDSLFLLGDFTVTHNTRLCGDLLRRINLNLPWPDGSPQTCPAGSVVLWIPADNQHPELGTIPTQFGFPPEALYLNATRRNPFAGTMLDAAADLKDLEDRINRIKPVFVFIDTSLNATDRSAHKPEDAKAFFKPLQEIAARTQTAILCVTHLNAGGKPLGRRITGQGRVVIQLETPDPEGQPNRRKLHVTKSNSLTPAPLGVTMGEAGNEYDTSPPKAPETDRNGAERGGKPSRLDGCCEWLRDRLDAGSDRVSDIRRDAEKEGFSTKTLYAAKDRLQVNEFELENRKWWQLTADEGG